MFREIAGNFDDAQHVAGVRQGDDKDCRLRSIFHLTTAGLGGICAPSVRVGAKKLVKEERAVPSSEPTQTRNQSQEAEAQNVTAELVRELVGALDDAIPPGEKSFTP